ncbi:hypothetical protein F383_11120 [Gossypium arboreum]|uniref:Uncharacterized protein n=1 Tax=Gossypium arboreum TaxID=29729 RepID=A0A0B0M6H6_GOSAR|nr:hypothetical protein F383_11120 [Gossypium arboreum]
MGQRTRLTRPGLPHNTAVSIWQNRSTTHKGRTHARVILTGSSTGVSHGGVPAEPKFSPIQKRPILRVLKHSKAYKYTLEEEEMEEAHGGRKELLKESQLIHLRSQIHHQD